MLLQRKENQRIQRKSIKSLERANKLYLHVITSLGIEPGTREVSGHNKTDASFVLSFVEGESLNAQRKCFE